MSRSQQSQVLQTAEGNSGADQSAATKANQAEVEDIGGYEAALSKYAANNPYVQGGEYQTAQNQTLAGTADAGSKAITDVLQRQSQRTGQNATAANLTAAEIARQNTRDLATQEATANQSRIGSEADYNKGVVAASEVPAQLEAGIYAPSLAGANSALNTAGDTAKTPGFWDTLGDTFAAALGKTAGAGRA